MRTFIILSVFILCTATALSQNLLRKVSLQGNNIPLEEVISEIEKKADVQFSYSPDAISAGETISLDIYQKSIKYILNKYFRSNHQKACISSRGCLMAI